jgi:hypothetical protein
MEIAGIRAIDLKKALADVPADAILIMSSDGEGNSASPLASINPGLYEPEQPWSGELVHPDDADDDSVPVWVLWPVN